MSMTGDDFDLEAELNAALDGDAKPVVEQEQIDQAPEGETAEQKQAREYARDEAGRFAAKAQEDASAQQQTQQTQQTQAKPAPKAWKPTWYKDEFGPWEQLGEPFRNALRDQERNASTAIEKHSTAAKAWEPIAEAVKPFEAQLRAQGQTPQQFIGGLVNIYGYLQENPVAALDWLAQQTIGQGWTIREVARWMDEQGHDGHKVDPVQQELAALKAQVQQLSQYPQQAQAQVVSKQIADWSQDKPDFAAVRQTMAALAKQNPEASLDQLYEQAQWAHPEIRDRILREQEDKRIAELKGKRQAGAQSPRGGQPNGALRNQRPTMSLEDEIAMHLDGGV